MERANFAEAIKTAREKRQWTQAEAADAVGVDANTWYRWEKGKAMPQGQVLRRVHEKFELEEPHCAVTVNSLEDDALSAFRKQDLTLHLMGIMWRWSRRNTQYHELQACITHAIEEHMKKDTDIISRRDALRRLALLPIEYYGLSAFRVTLNPVEEILTQCAAGIMACSYLRKGKELAFTAQTIASYVPTLKGIAESSQKVQRKAAADLLAQCLLLQSQLANQFDNSVASLDYAKQAEHYSEAAGNLTLQIVTIRTQANAHDFAHHWKQALQAAERARLLLKTNKDKTPPIPPLVESYIYAGLGDYRGHNGQKQDALYSLGEAHTAFPQSSDDSALTWIPHDEGNLLLHDGLAHLHLGLYKEARDSFERVTAVQSTSETIRIEALISQVTAELQREDQPRDMYYCIGRWKQGMQGAIAVQSDHWFNAARMAHTAMRAAWPSEQRVKDLRELIVHW